MHYQCRNPLRERDHRISLMPLLPARPEGQPSLLAGAASLFLLVIVVSAMIVAFT